MKYIKQILLVIFATILSIAQGQDAGGNKTTILNIDDTNSCGRILCTGEWIFNSRYMMDTTFEPISADLLPFRYSTQIKISESKWVFNKNHTYKVSGKYMTMDGVRTITKKDTTIIGTWSFDVAGTQYFAGDYSIKIRKISISPFSIDYHCLILVSSGTTLPYWDGSGEDYQDKIMQYPFLDNICNNSVWTHKK